MLRPRGKTALVLAGGGIMGAAYEIGCLTALDQLFRDDFGVNRFDFYVGVSAGSVIASLVANGISPAALFRAISRDERTVFNWQRRDIYRFDLLATLACVGRVFASSWRIYRSYRKSRSSFSFNDLIYILQEQFPSGLFSLTPMQQFLCRSFRDEGLCDDFRDLPRPLYIPAYDIDSGERVVFGDDEQNGVHICEAITASSAIPFFFTPQKIAGRYFIDGSIGRISHVDIAIEKGAKLVVLVNPRVPMVNDPQKICLPSLSYGHCTSIARLGIGAAWEQSQRIETRQKLDLALAYYRRVHPEVDILVLEPGPEESLLFFQSPMSQVARNQIMHYGYHLTLGQLNSRREEFSRALRRHRVPHRERPLTDIAARLAGSGRTEGEGP
ncbi:MAG: patatin family protein [Geothermobacteraceae bacterium]